eukprot:7117185-Prymnesium_polylepis.1
MEVEPRAAARVVLSCKRVHEPRRPNRRCCCWLLALQLKQALRHPTQCGDGVGADYLLQLFAAEPDGVLRQAVDGGLPRLAHLRGSTAG